MITLIGIVVIVAFSAIGWRRGGLRMLLSLAALFVAGLLASPLSGLGAALAGATGLVPRSLLVLAGTLISGIALFVIFMLPVEWWLRRREAQRGKEQKASWDQYGGAALGTLWGALMTTLVLTGITAVGQTQRAMRLANAEIEFRAERRRQEILRVERIPRAPYAARPGVPLTVELLAVDDSQLKLPEPAPAEEIMMRIEGSVFSPLVERVDPIDRKAEKTLRDLAVTVGDPCLYERFQDHPQVRQLMAEPRLRALAADPVIAAAVREGRYRDLLDHPQLVELAGDKDLAPKLKELKIEQLLKDIRTPDYAPLRSRESRTEPAGL